MRKVINELGIGGENDERKREKENPGQGKKKGEEYLLKGKMGKMYWKSRSKGRRKIEDI
jgi:hypothetical protein